MNSSILSSQGSSKSSSKVKEIDKTGLYYAKKGDQVKFRYEVLDELGKGAFGKVYKAYDHKNKEEVALKVLKSKDVKNEQGLNEVHVLKIIKSFGDATQHNIIEYEDTFIFRNHICMTFELMDMNLYEVIKGRNFRGLQLKYI